MIRLQRTVSIGRVDVPRLVAILAPLLQRLRDLKFGDDGIVETADGRALEGLRVTEGTHPRPPASYHIVTRREVATPVDEDGGGPEDGKQVLPAKNAPGWQHITITSGPTQTMFSAYTAELVADEARMFQLRLKEYGGPVDLLFTLPDPRRPTRLDLEVSGFLDGPWPIRAPVKGTGTVAVDQFPPAHKGKPQLSVTVRHRRVVGRLEVTVAPDTGQQWLVTIDIRVRFRGVFLIAAPFAALFRAKLQKVLDGVDPQRFAVFDEFMKAMEERFGPSPDPSMVANAATDALLGGIAEVVPPSDEIA